MLQPISKGVENLLALATELERVDKLYKLNDCAEGYYQGNYYHWCGTPACALGHYDAMRKTKLCDDVAYVTCIEFGITVQEESEIFGSIGCGGAQTAGEAAAYIRKFIARKIEALA